MMGLTHRRHRRAVGPFADGELDRRARELLLRHLADCTDCSDDLAMVAAIKQSLARHFASVPPPAAVTRLRLWAEGIDDSRGARP